MQKDPSCLLGKEGKKNSIDIILQPATTVGFQLPVLDPSRC